jgi:predicted AAA+ superfamily ATPase
MSKEFIENDIIVREKYLNKTIPYINKQIIKVFTGQRRVGKSYVLKQTMQYVKLVDKKLHIIYIDKENLSFAHIKSAMDLNDYVKSNSKQGVKNYIFIDEVQEIEKFELALRSLLLDDLYDIYCTGSNADMLSGEISTYLSGRYIEIEVNALSFSEFLQFQNLENDNHSLKQYLRYGGLPYLKHLELTDEIVFGYLKGVYNTILYRDIVKRHHLRNTVFLENLTGFLADNVGQLFSAKSISDYLKSQMTRVPVSQIIDYLRYLSESYMIHKVGRMEISGKKIFEIGEKYYFEDIGLRNAFWEYRPDDIGKIMENTVYKQLVYNDYEIKIGQLTNHEIDFVCKKNREYLYVQVCYLLHNQSTIEREFGNLEKINDNYPKVVISMDDFHGNSRNGIHHIRLNEFLLTKN